MVCAQKGWSLEYEITSGRNYTLHWSLTNTWSRSLGAVSFLDMNNTQSQLAKYRLSEKLRIASKVAYAA